MGWGGAAQAQAQAHALVRAVEVDAEAAADQAVHLGNRGRIGVHGNPAVNACSWVNVFVSSARGS